MKKWMDEFKTFISQGNVLSMAIGIIIGGAFNAIVSSLIDDIIMHRPTAFRCFFRAMVYSA